MLPGIQVMFGFLVTVPFTALTSLRRNAHSVLFMSTPVATAFVVAPSSYRRLRWRQYDIGLPLSRRAREDQPR